MIRRFWHWLFPPRVKAEPIPHPERLVLGLSITTYDLNRRY